MAPRTNVRYRRRHRQHTDPLYTTAPWKRRPYPTTDYRNRWPYSTSTYRQQRPYHATDFWNPTDLTYTTAPPFPFTTDYWHRGDYPNTPYWSDSWSLPNSRNSNDNGLLGFAIIEAEVCEVALASYSLSILVAVIFLVVDVVTIRDPHLYLCHKQAMRYFDIVTATVTALLVTGSLSYYLYGFSETLKSINDINLDPPGAETAAASMIIVFNVATLISWVSCMLGLKNKLNYT